VRTTNESSSRSLATQLKTKINKWRLAFLAFALIYAVLVSLDLSTAPLQWDEVVHLNDGALLLRGAHEQLNYFYPPLFDGVTMVFFKVLGVSVLSGRLVSVTFSLLSLWVVFELAYRMYDGKTALTASILLGIFPGYFWLSRVAMIETMLVFFFTASMLFFFSWLRKPQNKMLVLSGLALGLGFLTKYQMLIAAVVMIASILLLARDRLKLRFSRFTLLIITAIAVVTPWIIISYNAYASEMLNNWAYALQVGNPEKSLYSARFPLPVFYLIEMTWPYNDVHPISLLIYIVSLLGLGLFAWRRKREDKFLLAWFIVVFVFFTLIPNKHWRYVLPLFPVLAISAASFIFFFYEKTKRTWTGNISINKKRAVKVAAGVFTVFLAVGVVFSVKDAYDGVAQYQIQIDIEGATKYACNSLNQNESIMLLCPFNLFNQDMVRFYLWADGTRKNKVCQYPELPVDTYTPNFNITEFIDLCKKDNVKYVFTYEYGGVVPYFNTTLNLQQIYMMLYDSGNFSHISEEATFGSNPRRIFILTFLG
jgi:4-amino-4-deoxy-L-arabinose transferase-like glycosyltransferase